MLRASIAVGASLLVLTVASTAGAQEAGRGFGQRGGLSLSADRFVPLFAYNHNSDSGTNTTSNSTSFSLLPSFNQLADNGNFYNIPRLALDYFVIDRLSIGGSVGVYFNPSASTTATTNNTSVTTDTATQTFFEIGPRVGYAVPLTESFVFWPRLGFSYNTLTVSNPTRSVNLPIVCPCTESSSDNQWQMALNVEALFVITPVRHFGLTLGPVVDIPFAGNRSTNTTTTSTTSTTKTSTSADTSQFHFGVTAGLIGWFGGP